MIYYNSAWLIGLCTVAIYDAARSVLLAVHNSYLDCVLPSKTVNKHVSGSHGKGKVDKG